MYKNILSKISLVSLLLIFSYCSKDDDPVEVNEVETFTRVTLNIGGEDYEYNVGSPAPEIKLALGQDYKTSVKFYDASNPEKIEDMTKEVIAEADVHFVFFEWSGVGLNITSNSSDVIGAESKGINLSTDWTTTDNGSGNLRLELIHKPTNVAGTTRAAIGGETDIQVDWPIVVE
tara:strand:- start:1114 stop:1638 length:525 start_codon:yes stop_codon:yes gene_type:complete